MSGQGENEMLVSVIVPCRNESVYIVDVVKNAIAQLPRDGSELIVADGMSDDGTREILNDLKAVHSSLIVIDNPSRIVSAGLNSAIRASHADVIVRMDVHTKYAPDYIEQCLRVMRESGADNVGGPWRAEGKGYLQSAIAMAFQSRFSSGGASSHRVDYEGVVDSVYLGCWRRDVFDRFGLFDEELVRNQDDEHNLRITRGGGKIWQSPKIMSSYVPRASLRKLFAQYAQYGYWKVRVIQKHRIPASFRHLVPAIFVGTLFMSMLLAPVSKLAAVVFFWLAGSYLVVNLIATLSVCAKPRNWRYLPVMPLIFMCFHFGYGYGFLRGMLDFFVRKRGHEKFSTLTRS